MPKRKAKEGFLVTSLEVECPDLCLDWHPTKNLPLTPATVSYGSEKRVWWQCRTCGHEWEAYINNRRKQYKYPGQAGTGCKNCLGRVPNLENSIAAFRPEIIEEWHPTKNLPDTIYSVSRTTSKKCFWVCMTCEKEWEATVASRAGGSGCPSCGEFKNHKLSISKEWKSLNQNLVLKSKRISHGK